LGIVQVLVP